MKHIRSQPSTRPLMMASRKMSPRKASHGTSRIMKATAATMVRKGRRRRRRRLLPPLAAPPRLPWVGRGTSGTPASDTPRWQGAAVTPGKAGRLQSAGSRLLVSCCSGRSAVVVVVVVVCSHQ